MIGRSKNKGCIIDPLFFFVLDDISTDLSRWWIRTVVMRDPSGWPYFGWACVVDPTWTDWATNGVQERECNSDYGFAIYDQLDTFVRF